MELETVLACMASNAQVIRTLVADSSDEQARWRPEPGAWSVLEVINHLLDEEREDFRARLDLVLHRPADAWFKIDPQGWVVQRGYNQRQLGASLEAFLAAREESLAWLRGLASPDWEQGFDAPFGRIRAGDVLAAWAAHDLLHMRQLVELRWAYQRMQVAPYDVRYAGVW
jgi:hypothetical protein